ncbi:MAG: hypothetical protein ABI307_03925 [Mycobacterium sp.]
MGGLQERLAAMLAEVLSVDAEPDGALTVHHDGTLASLRVVTIAEGLDLVSLNQVLAWDLPLTGKVRDRVNEQARDSQLGTVTLVEKDAAPAEAAKRNSGKTGSNTGDVMLRYNFPGSGLTDDALCTLILLVLAKGVDIRDALT